MLRRKYLNRKNSDCGLYQQEGGERGTDGYQFRNRRSAHIRPWSRVFERGVSLSDIFYAIASAKPGDKKRVNMEAGMNRRKKAGVLAAAALLLCVLAARHGAPQEQTRYTATFLNVFDTKTDIIGYGTSQEEFTEQIELLREKLVCYHELYDIYHDYEGINNIKTINDNAGIAPVEVDPEIIRLLQFSKEMYRDTDGQVNIAMGSVLSIWHDYREAGNENPAEAKLPPAEELRAAAEHTDIADIIIDEEASTVYLNDPQMSLDVGSIGKGYAVQRVAEYAKEIGMEHVLLSVGGNICAVGERLDGTKWRLGIQNPDIDSETAYVKKVDVADACVVTSGNYQRYYMVDGERYCHIIDPDTLMPADYFLSVSIIAKDSGVADALSTSVYNMPYEEGLAFVNGLDGVEAMWIMEDGSIRYSENFEAYVAE